MIENVRYVQQHLLFIFFILLHHFQMRSRAADIPFGRKIFFCEKYSTSPASLYPTKCAYELFLEQQNNTVQTMKK